MTTHSLTKQDPVITTCEPPFQKHSFSNVASGKTELTENVQTNRMTYVSIEVEQDMQVAAYITNDSCHAGVKDLPADSVQSVLRLQENYILPHDSENDSCSSDLCKETFKEAHVSTRHVACNSEDAVLSCDDCQKPIKVESIELAQKVIEDNSSTLYRTVQNFSDNPIKCVQNMNHNVVGHPGSEEKKLNQIHVDGQLVCKRGEEPCDKYNIQSSNCKLSISVDLGNESYNESASPENVQMYVTTGKLVVPESRVFRCIECGKVFSKEYTLREHLAYHSNERPFPCEQCGKGFKTRSNLDTHLISHSKETPFSCEQCGKGFKTRSKLGSHLKRHSGERPFSCEQCGKAFKARETLVCHIASHTEERSFSCEECGKTFKTHLNLKEHLKIHSNERPFCCEICGKAFKTRGNLRSHLRSHSEDRPFSCEQCGKAFKSYGELRIHFVSHSEERPFSCGQCEKAFKTRVDLETHLLSHSDQRRFCCEQCGKSFKTRLVLRNHQRCHSNKRPFSCEQCGKAFKTRGEVKSHVKTHLAKDFYPLNSGEKHSNSTPL